MLSPSSESGVNEARWLVITVITLLLGREYTKSNHRLHLSLCSSPLLPFLGLKYLGISVLSVLFQRACLLR